MARNWIWNDGSEREKVRSKENSCKYTHKTRRKLILSIFNMKRCADKTSMYVYEHSVHKKLVEFVKFMWFPFSICFSYGSYFLLYTPGPNTYHNRASSVEVKQSFVFTSVYSAYPLPYSFLRWCWHEHVMRFIFNFCAFPDMHTCVSVCCHTRVSVVRQ